MLFWIVCAALTAGVIVALARPLVASRAATGNGAADLEVYRDQLNEVDADKARGLISDAEAQAARVEISRRLLASASAAEAASRDAAPGRSDAIRMVLYGIAAGVPVMALALYLALGSPGLPGQEASERLAQARGADASVAALVAKVEARLREHPEDGRGWDVIAPVYLHQGRYQEAADAYARAIALLGETVQRLSGFGQATVLASNEVVTEAARKAFARVHELEPARPEPRFWLALAKEQDGDLQGAADDLSALLDSAPADASWREAVAERLQAVSGRLGQAAKDAAPGPSAADITAAAKLPPQQQSEMISQMVEGLAQKLKANGNDLPGWQRLLRSYTVLGQTDKAERALIEARKALAGDGSALSELNAFAKALGLKS